MRCLSPDQAMELHRRVLARSGGSDGVRDSGALESALAQPQMGFGGQDLYPTLAEKAAALSFSLINNHPFVDGNKRIGHAAAEAFLAMNGFEFNADVDEQERVVLAVAAGTMNRDEWTNWVRAHLQELK